MPPSAPWSWSYEQVDRCREPGTFLAFALNKLRHAFQQEQRARKSSDTSLGEDDLDLVLADGEPDALEQRLLSEENTSALLQAVERLADPRQRSVVLWKFFVGAQRRGDSAGSFTDIQPGHVRACCATGDWTGSALTAVLKYSLSGDSPALRAEGL